MTVLTRRSALAGGLLATTPLVPATARTPDLPFLVLGDWGRDGRYQGTELAATMARYAEAAGSRFVVSVGDNFYENGIRSVTDPQWRTSFEDVFTQSPLMTPWHVIPGNHDYRGNVDAQIAYHGNGRWRMPARYYVRSESLPDGAAADFFHIDTSPFVLEYLGTRTRIEGQDTDAQLRWLERALAASSATWKIVVGHHPVFTTTGGPHDTDELIGQVKPLLERYGVRAYLSGHIHNLQETVVDGVVYVVSGAGSQLGRVKRLQRPGFAAERRGFVLARLSRDALALSYVDVDGAVLRDTLLRRA